MDHALQRDKIQYTDPVTLKGKKNWFKVNDITSLTKEEENKRQEKAREKSFGKKRKCPVGGSDKERKSSKATKCNGSNVTCPSLLDATIDQIISSEKLNGDTVNLYFDFLGEKLFCENENICLGSSYFYPSLQRQDNRGTYSKYIGKKSLWEYENLILPVHLADERHWILVLISVVNLCIYIYDSAYCSQDTYKTVFGTIKTKFIRQELQHLKSEDRALFQEENWDEEIPNCPKQKNQEDCGVNDLHTSIPTEDQKVALDQEVASAGLTYRQPPTPKDGNCLFHAMSDQLTRVGRLPQTPSKLRSDLVRYLKSNSTTPDGVHFREFINHGGWDTYLRRMSRDGEWGDWIALWGLVNMLNLPVALVSSLGEGGLQIINPATNGDEGGDITVMALLGHEAEVHYHSLEALQDPVTEMKVKYGEGKVTEEICPKCGKKFACYSQGVFEGLNGMLQVYSDDSFFCDNCQMLEDFDYMP
ncbi:unnamed protein product [Porites evermanni]|uniref:Ubiquitinyl hydrolase 1 n=1 Tax=Porites evermanni TaxID=104178 RepID=A0ABN8SPH2_9CNID|nr:unnamed protein product [Porites evermanni]